MPKGIYPKIAQRLTFWSALRKTPPVNLPRQLLTTPRPGNRQTHLDALEAESIHIIREVVAECEKPVMLYSIGKGFSRDAASGDEGVLSGQAAVSRCSTSTPPGSFAT